MFCNVTKEWYDSLGPSKQQKDILLKTTTADTGAQCFLLGSKHLPGLGLGVPDLLQSEINLNCANSTAAGNLGVFFAKVRGEHHETKEVVASRTMVYVIEGDLVIVSKAVLETLGCIPKTFPQVGEFLNAGDKALAGKLLQSTHVLQAGGLMGQEPMTYLRRLSQQLMTSQNMSTPAPLLPMLVRPVQPARRVG